MEYNNPLPLLKAFRLRPQKDLGQNFLVDENILSRIVECADLAPTAQVLEIGAGLGSLTYFLAQAATPTCWRSPAIPPQIVRMSIWYRGISCRWI
jgi:protein-L-isoaspartate O-methyltransferase